MTPIFTTVFTILGSINPNPKPIIRRIVIFFISFTLLWLKKNGILIIAITRYQYTIPAFLSPRNSLIVCHSHLAEYTSSKAPSRFFRIPGRFGRRPTAAIGKLMTLSPKSSASRLRPAVRIPAVLHRTRNPWPLFYTILWLVHDLVQRRYRDDNSCPTDRRPKG